MSDPWNTIDKLIQRIEAADVENKRLQEALADARFSLRRPGNNLGAKIEEAEQVIDAALAQEESE